jgi:hypothetical protein
VVARRPSKKAGRGEDEGARADRSAAAGVPPAVLQPGEKTLVAARFGLAVAAGHQQRVDRLLDVGDRDAGRDRDAERRLDGRHAHPGDGQPIERPVGDGIGRGERLERSKYVHGDHARIDEHDDEARFGGLPGNGRHRPTIYP